MKDKIDALLKTLPLARLKDLRDQITHRYKTQKHKGIVSIEEAISYLAFRTPATTAVQRRVFEELSDTSFSPKSMTDLGAGMGVSYETASSFFPSITNYTGIEENPYMIDVGKKLTDKINWIQASYLATEIPKSDLILGSYTFSELSQSNLEIALKKLGQPHNTV